MKENSIFGNKFAKKNNTPVISQMITNSVLEANSLGTKIKILDYSHNWEANSLRTNHCSKIFI